MGRGAALTAAITTEAVGYVFLLIPNRIREIKEEGRREAHAEGMREGRIEGREEGRIEGREEGRREGRAEAIREGLLDGRREGRAEAMREGRAEARREVRSRLAKLRARYERGEITLDGFFERVVDVFEDRCDVCGRSG